MVRTFEGRVASGQRSRGQLRFKTWMPADPPRAYPQRLRKLAPFAFEGRPTLWSAVAERSVDTAFEFDRG